MFSLLHLLSYVGAVAAFVFVTLSLASGLLWCAELVEEHVRLSKIIGMRAIYTIITLHILLLYTDALPVLPTLFSVACHLLYLSNFTPSWPVISLSSPKFIASCLAVIADHFTWFFYFTKQANLAKVRRAPPRYSYGNNGGNLGRVKGEHGFMEVAAFFGILVWSVPLFLFLSLSANDNALPSMVSAPPSPGPGGIDLSSPAIHGSSPRRSSLPRTSLLKSLLVPIVSLLPRIRRRNGKRDDEGLLAPRTPIRGSPLHSPVHMGGSSSSSGGYFPWGGESSTTRPSTPSVYGGGNGTSLSPETAKTRPRPQLHIPRPNGPPRRVQSEVYINKGSPANPRGIATRNGVPATSDDMLRSDTADLGSASGTNRSVLGLSSGGGEENGPPAISLGPRGADKVGGTEVLESTGLIKRKAD